MIAVAGWFLLAGGMFLMLFGVVGSLILGDLFLRFHAATKCGVSGTISFLLGLALLAGRWDFSWKLFVIIIFTVLTSPMATHILAFSRMDELELDDAEEHP